MLRVSQKMSQTELGSGGGYGHWEMETIEGQGTWKTKNCFLLFACHRVKCERTNDIHHFNWTHFFHKKVRRRRTFLKQQHGFSLFCLKMGRPGPLLLFIFGLFKIAKDFNNLPKWWNLNKSGHYWIQTCVTVWLYSYTFRYEVSTIICIKYLESVASLSKKLLSPVFHWNVTTIHRKIFFVQFQCDPSSTVWQKIKYLAIFWSVYFSLSRRIFYPNAANLFAIGYIF